MRTTTILILTLGVMMHATSARALEDYGTPPMPPLAALTGSWQSDGYAIAWQADAPACLMVDNELLGDVLCTPSGQVVLARAGGDWHTAAIPGRTLTLVAATVITQPLVSVVIPEEARRVALPVVAGR